MGDLNVVLADQDASPSVTLWNQEGGAADNINKTWTGLTNFNGQPVNQNWALWARDLAAGDTGYISTWWIRVYYNSSNTAPNQPGSLTVYGANGSTVIAVGGTTYDRSVVLKGQVSDPDGDQVKLQIELRRLDEYAGGFTGDYTQESPLVTTGSTASIPVTLYANGQYHWRARAVDSRGGVGSWASAGGNADSASDFTISYQVPVTVKGVLKYSNRTFNQNGWLGWEDRLARYVTIDILGANVNVLESTWTDANGLFSKSVPSLFLGQSFTLQVRAETEAVNVGPPNQTQTWISSSFLASSATTDVGTVLPSGTMHQALNILDSIVDGYNYAIQRSGKSPSRVKVDFPVAGCNGVSCYDQLWNFISITSDDGYLDDVVLHEYGHFVMDDYTLYITLGAGGPHFACQTANDTLAFSEAWAHYFAGRTTGRSEVHYSPASYLDLEANRNTVHLGGLMRTDTGITRVGR